MLSHNVFSPVVTPRGRLPDGSTQVCKKGSHMNWPHDVSFAQTLQILVSVLYYISLFYCFVNWTPEATIFRLVRFMPRFRHKIIPNTKFQKPEKQIWKNFKTKRKIQVSSFIRCAFVSSLQNSYRFSSFFLHSAEDSWNLTWRNVKREFIFIQLFCFHWLKYEKPM